MREFLPVALAFVSALLFYLGSPGQQWRAAPLWPRFSRRAALIALIAAVISGGAAGHLATTLSIVITTLMASFVAFPFVAALCKRSAGTAR
ncbi:hypothetical protein [Burkholderia sp. Ac-20365]|jgi:hypothetical protein|uniref:hypothetical protein n=1 Tax=Burkholderia sp. Ac-20365 TaxID=2703897 RepID=UPI00197BDE0F|nr:hypothetical protein [Burkholderia sp. Ac-20365]MBN3763598.1 hypothetical protein [Burkholderia sp. Ac-20365]